MIKDAFSAHALGNQRPLQALKRSVSSLESGFVQLLPLEQTSVLPATWLASARATGADQQLTASSRFGLDQQDTKGINRSVQRKNRPILGAVSTAVAIPITRLSAPIFDAIKK